MKVKSKGTIIKYMTLSILMLFIGWSLSAIYSPINILPKDGNLKVNYCYHRSPCTVYIYLEQQVGCYKGCQILNNYGGEDYDSCVEQCEEYYGYKYRRYE